MKTYVLLWFAFVFYAASLLFALWRLTLGKPYRYWPKLILVLPGFLLHTFYLWDRGFSQGRCPVTNLFEILIFITWCLVALHLVITITKHINYLTVFYMPIVLVVQLAALSVPMDQPNFGSWKEGPWLGLHASTIILGYAAFALAGAVAFMYLLQERQLKTHRLGTSFMLLPPISRLESLQSWLLVTGFLLLTIGLLSGFAWLYMIHKSLLQTDAKFFWSLAVWGIYFILILSHYLWGLNGRRMAWISISSFVFVLSTFWVANVLSQFHRY